MEHTPKMRYTLLNAGLKTRTDFMEGLVNATSEFYRTKEILLHINEQGEPRFFSESKEIDLLASYVFIRLRATDSHFCGMLAEYLKHNHIKMSDPINLSYRYSAGKITQMLLLALNGIRIPETYIFREESFAKNYDYLKEHLVFPLVYKLEGSKGSNVFVIDSFEALEKQLALKSPHRLALVQTIIPNTFDTRTLIFNDTILGTISRTRTHGFHNNISRGAKAERFMLTPEEENVARQATRVCRIDFAGVDMIHTPTGPFVLEVNKSPQVKGFESIYDMKVLTHVARLIQKSE